MNILATYELGEPQPFRPAPKFSYWDTAKLYDMIQIARKHVAEAQAAFDATQEIERRRGRRIWESEGAADYVRRASDIRDLMVAELKRRASECFVEKRVGPRKGPEYRQGMWDRLPAPASETAEREAA